jgi:hypothetical protein
VRQNLVRFAADHESRHPAPAMGGHEDYVAASFRRGFADFLPRHHVSREDVERLVTVSPRTFALISLANATPFLMAASDSTEPSVGRRMCLNIFAFLRVRSWLDSTRSAKGRQDTSTKSRAPNRQKGTGTQQGWRPRSSLGPSSVRMGLRGEGRRLAGPALQRCGRHTAHQSERPGSHPALRRARRCPRRRRR